jgi:hypothetical protein
MSKFLRPLVAALLALSVSSSFASRSIAPPTLDEEAMQKHQDDRHMALAMWFSTGFMEKAASARGGPEAARQVIARLDGYAIFAILDVKIDTNAGALVPGDSQQMRASARLRLGDRAPMAIVREDDLPADVRTTVRIVKPVIANMLGKFGDAIELVVFKDADEHGHSLMTPSAHLQATLDFDKETFAWALPSISLLPTRIDPATGDTFPGDFDYSPFTGRKLELRK